MDRNGNILRWFGTEFSKNIEENYVKPMLMRATAEVEAIIQELIRAPKHGKVYKIGKRTTYTASAGGEAPAVRTGRLRQSIRHVITKTGAFEWSAVVGPTVKDYPGILEKGSKYMKPRPLFGAALIELRKRMPGILAVSRVR